MSASVVWATGTRTPGMEEAVRAFPPNALDQWSRKYEYPWILENGQFAPGQWVLDAGGGGRSCPLQSAMANLGCHVVNLDLIATQHRVDSRVLYIPGDIRQLPFLNDSFQRIVCCSVLEHTGDPAAALRELWRVTAGGGRLLATFDVASRLLHSDNLDHRHWVTRDSAERLLGVVGLDTPPVPDDALKITADGSDDCELTVLCFYKDKP